MRFLPLINIYLARDHHRQIDADKSAAYRQLAQFSFPDDDSFASMKYFIDQSYLLCQNSQRTGKDWLMAHIFVEVSICMTNLHLALWPQKKTNIDQWTLLLFCIVYTNKKHACKQNAKEQPAYMSIIKSNTHSSYSNSYL